MGRVLETAREHEAQENDTLQSIVTALNDGQITWQDVAKYNWGTVVPREVNRALCETIGVKTLNDTHPEQSVLDPALGPRETEKKIRLPKVWKKNSLDQRKTHLVRVKRRTPAPAIEFTQLDRWFIPETETCRLRYQLHGIVARADKVDLRIYASKYCRANANDAGDFCRYGFRAVDDTPIYSANNLTATARSGQNRNWTGESNATAGMLQPRGGQTRYVNVALSPYTVVLRYYKNNDDQNARIDLAPFWPRFRTTLGDDPVVDESSLKIVWTVQNCGKLRAGQLIIWNRDNEVVYRRGLASFELTEGEHSFQWPPSDDHPDPDELPYRVQILANSGAGQPDGLALAVMQTEVRLFVHPWIQQAPPMFDPDGLSYYKGFADRRYTEVTKTGVQLGNTGSVKKVNLVPTRPGAVSDQTHTVFFRKTKLIGSAPDTLSPEEQRRIKKFLSDLLTTGHVFGAFTNLKLNIEGEYGNTRQRNRRDNVKTFLRNLFAAVKEPQNFQFAFSPFIHDATLAVRDGTDAQKIRWYKYKLAQCGFHPGPVDTDDSSPSFALALKELQRSHPKVGGPPHVRLTPDGARNDDTRDTLDALANETRKFFGDLADRDDISLADIPRHLNHDGQEVILWVDAHHSYTRPLGGRRPNHAIQMNNYRGGMSIGTTTAADKRDTPRPWIPLEMALPLLSRDTHLDDRRPPLTTTAHMRRAAGPLRVDWTFDDVPENFAVFESPLPNRSRPRRFVSHVIEHFDQSKDDRTYSNCLAKYGGIRPEDPQEYFKKAFGLGRRGLRPWIAQPDDGAQCIATLMHDDLRQANQYLHAAFLGKAGVYAHPSRIAGDGYRYRARVSFEPANGRYLFPNHEVLRQRYPRLPQATTCNFRIWRKTSFRTYIQWTDVIRHQWDVAKADIQQRYRSSYVHFVDNTGGAKPITDYLTNLRYKQIVSSKFPGPNNVQRRDQTQINRHADYVWPWVALPQMGIPHGPLYAKVADAEKNWKKNLVNGTATDFWCRYNQELIYELLKKIESQDGKLRGHVVMQFRGSPTYWVQIYGCSRCKKYSAVIEKTAAGGSAPNCRFCNQQLWPCQQETVRCRGRNHHEEDRWLMVRPDRGAFWPKKKCSSSWCFSNVDLHTAAPLATKIRRVRGGHQSGLTVPCQGLVLGVTVDNIWAALWAWAHELGHNRHLEHAAGAPGWKDARTFGNVYDLHDHTANTHDDEVMNDKKPEKRNWDRCCAMSYNRTETLCFCGKCVLKGRGWDITELPDKALPGPKVKD